MCGSSQSLPGRILTDVATGGLSEVGGAIGVGAKAPGAPNLPGYPNMTPDELALLQKQQGNLSQFGDIVQGASKQLGNNQSILQQVSGLFNQDGSINQNALAALQQQSQQSNQAAGSAGLAALGASQSGYGAMNDTASAYENALKNGAPANQQIGFQQNQNFQAMKEQAAQQGITISGDNWANAVSNSTAGQKLLQNAQQNNNIQNQNYNLGYVGQLAGNMGQLSGAAGQAGTSGMGLSSYATQNPLNYAQSSITNGMSALAPMLQQYGQMANSMYQPYYMQQIGPYQQQMAQAQANYQAQMNQYQGQQNMIGGLMGLGGTLGGAYLGGPAGAMIGRSAMGGGPSSSPAQPAPLYPTASFTSNDPRYS